MKTKLLSKIRKNYIIMKPNGITLMWTAWNKTSDSPYWISKNSDFDVFIFRILLEMYGNNKARKIVSNKHLRYCRYRCLLFL